MREPAAAGLVLDHNLLPLGKGFLNALARPSAEDLAANVMSHFGPILGFRRPTAGPHDATGCLLSTSDNVWMLEVRGSRPMAGWEISKPGERELPLADLRDAAEEARVCLTTALQLQLNS